nr:DegT/DnrJ/EryC1/StrS family aminotransferase [Acidobacteriota bacterium]
LNDLSAAVGLAQFRRLDSLLSNRAAVAAMYSERLASIEGITPLPPPCARMTVSWFLYVIRIADHIDRDHLANHLESRGIPTRPYFWPIHLQPPYVERFGYEAGQYPHSESAGQMLLALPFHGGLSEGEVDAVSEALREAVQQSA